MMSAFVKKPTAIDNWEEFAWLKSEKLFKNTKYSKPISKSKKKHKGHYPYNDACLLKQEYQEREREREKTNPRTWRPPSWTAWETRPINPTLPPP